jgi:hypothetical protein
MTWWTRLTWDELDERRSRSAERRGTLLGAHRAAFFRSAQLWVFSGTVIWRSPQLIRVVAR